MEFFVIPINFHARLQSLAITNRIQYLYPHNMTAKKSFLYLLFTLILIEHKIILAEESINVGWIGPMSGATAKYGAFQAATLAEEDINRAGGINGKKIKLIFEDGKGGGLSAVMAAQKLVNIDKVKYILGGHSSPESLAIAPILEKAHVIMLAAITSSPSLTKAGDYIFRATAVSTIVAELLAPYAIEKLGLKRIAILYEETDYARPQAERFAELLSEHNAPAIDIQSYNPSETDFRTILSKFKIKKIDGLYVGVQSPDRALLILQQIKVLGLKAQLFGNEITGNSVSAYLDSRDLFEGLIYAEPPFNQDSNNTSAFINRFKKRFNTDSLPFGFWTAEAYDTVNLLAQVISECGDNVDKVKDCLYKIKDYDGVSAPISIDENGDGVRKYVIKQIRNGKGVEKF